MPTVALAQFFDTQFSVGSAPAAGYQLFTYVVGTSTKQATYTDSTGNSANENPIVLDSEGRCDLWLLTSANYKFRLCLPTESDPPTSSVKDWNGVGWASPTFEDLTVTDDVTVGGDLTVTGTATITSIVIGDWIYIKQPDQTATITTGTAKVSLPAMPACTILAVRAGLVTASSSGIPTFDINDDGVSIFDTAKLTIDANESTSLTAAASPTILNPTVASGSLLTIDIDVAGTGAKGWVILLNVRLT